MIRESLVGLFAGPADPTASLLDSAEPENEETSLWPKCGSLLVKQTINHGLPFSPVNYLFKIYFI